MTTPPPAISFDVGLLRRLHPATFIIEFARAIGRFLWAIIVVFVLSVTDGKGDSSEIFFAAIGILGGVSALVRYWTTSYAVIKDHLVVKTGVFQKQVRTIPIDKVQDIQMVRNLLHRVLGITDLKIETAAGVGAECELSAVSLKEADRLRYEILGSHAGVRERSSVAGFVGPGLAPIPVQPEHPQIYHARIGDLALLGSTENRLFAFIAWLSGFFALGSQIDIGALLLRIERSFSWVPFLPTFREALIAALVIVAMFLGWIAAIATSIVGYWNYTVRSSGEQLTRQFGLLTQHENNVPLRRIQAVRLRGTWLSLLIGFCQVQVRTAGSAELTGEHVMFPIVRKREFASIVRHLFQKVDFDSVRWKPISRRSIRRGFFLHLWPGLIFGALFSVPLSYQIVPTGSHPLDGLTFTDWGSTFARFALAWLVASVALAYARFRGAGYDQLEDFWICRTGVFTRSQLVVPLAKIQTVRVTQSYFQRRGGLATVVVTTAGSFGSGALWDLPFREALELADWLAAGGSRSELFMVDGV
ncbi:MAG TPA: PH domain-containing protein [Fimbriimonadaceae bacterium]|nr:PH domain-containing protein [Fimbriimonadaceae bacterium]HRJ33779.1 PH domain-containing protein [Fimbriimonadaceae bacterium]